MKKVIVLGAKGRFGRAAVNAFDNAGWQVTAFARNWTGGPTGSEKRVTGDVTDKAGLANACMGQDVIVNAINPPYEDWAVQVPKITAAVLHAAKASLATVVIPGNVYNYGAGMPAVLSEKTPWAPTTRKGLLRVEMEEAYRSSGLRTIVLRAGDFIEGTKTGNWFDSYIAVKSHRGKTMYPGPLNQVHAWAYLPDMARAMVALADRRDGFDAFEEFCFEGFGVTGDALVKAITATTGKKQKVSGLPWAFVRFAGLFSKPMKEIVEMRYLWRVPHQMDGSKFRQTVPDFTATPLPTALAEVLKPQNDTEVREKLSFSAATQ